MFSFKELTVKFKKLKPVLAGFVVTMHKGPYKMQEDPCKQEVKSQGP